MAAEKLTKQRLIQIVFMLTILIIAFVWRTVTYTNETILDCKGEVVCSVTVSSHTLTISKIAMSTYEIDGIPSQWEITSEVGELSHLDGGKWKFALDFSQMEQKPTILINGNTRINMTSGQQ